MDVIDAIHGRRSIRSYETRAVPRELIEAIVLDAAQAPPPFSGQVPWSFVVIEGRERIAGLGVRAKQFAKDHRTEGDGSAWADRDDFKVFWDAPAVILICGAVHDCCRAGQNLMLSAHARGLGTCWVGSPMPWLRDVATRKELSISNDKEPVSALCLGYPRAVPEAVPRPRPEILWA